MTAVENTVEMLASYASSETRAALIGRALARCPEASDPYALLNAVLDVAEVEANDVAYLTRRLALAQAEWDFARRWAIAATVATAWFAVLGVAIRFGWL